MVPFSAWIQAARPRTLPLALAGLALGNFIAAFYQTFSWAIALSTVATAFFLQVLSNFANDYGDFVNGADNDDRIGPARAVQSGAISAAQMKRAMVITSVLALLFGVLSLYYASQNVNILPLLLMLGLGFGAIWAAIKYTSSANPYGYKGYGDLAVFVFFGLLAVLGSFYLQSGEVKWLVALPAAGFGLFSTGVLNLNNMRDIVNDKAMGKITVAVRLGLAKAKFYHAILIIAGCFLFVIFAIESYTATWQFLFLIPIGFMILHLIKVNKRHNHAEFNPLLKELSLSSALLALTIGIGLII